MRIRISFDNLRHSGPYDFLIDRAGILIRVPRDLAEIVDEEQGIMMVERGFAEENGLIDEKEIEEALTFANGKIEETGF